MNTQIFCQMSGCGCDHPQRCQQVCEATLTTGNGGNTVTKGQPLPPRPKQFETDFGITHHTRPARWYETLPIVRLCAAIAGFIVAVSLVVRFVLYAINR
jgi:hypothetical protein